MYFGPWLAAFLALALTMIIARGIWLYFFGDRSIPDRIDVTMPTTGQQFDFHKIELQSLKAEIAELIKASSTNYQYAIAGSVGVFTWLVTVKSADASETILRNALWLPFLLASLLFSLSVGQNFRIGQMGQYLHLVEQRFSEPQLGWEKALRRLPPILRPIYFVGWIVLLIVDAFVPIMGLK
jgi:hypothetical protein